MTGPRWYAVEAGPREEHLACRSIIEKGYNAHLPMVSVLRRAYRAGVQDGRKTEVHIPMFGGYLFVEFDRDNQPWAPIRYCEGVRRIFTTSSHVPIPVKAGLVEWLIEDAPRRLRLPINALVPIKRGILIQIAHHHPMFSGFLGECLQCDGITTTIEVVMFGRPCAVTVKREDVRVVD